VPQGRTVLAGSGPLLLLLADQLRRAGTDIAAVLDTTPSGNFRAALPLLPNFLTSPYALYGLKLLGTARLSLPIRRNVSSLTIIGDRKVESVSFTRNGREETVNCDQVLLHQGVIPNINMPNALGCAQHWDDSIHAWVPTVDAWFSSSIPGIAIAGDGAGIAGAASAAVRGRIAAIASALMLGRLDTAACDKLAAPLLAEAARLSRGRRFIDRLYRPAEHLLRPSDPSTIICRCEEVRAGQIREVAQRLHVQGPNQLKAYLRTGMGPCQGRMCGPSVIELIAEQRNVPVAEVGYYRLRTPVKPITLAEIASMPQSEAAKNAVMR
jgi:NADPH-dependent 2,4-dienoyl-CoA reductase/sulfur reductase-like enzyme